MPSDETRAETESFLDEYPEAEQGLKQLVEIDSRASSWTFDDAPFDSGRFGELVARGIVEEADDGDYRLADPASVETALSGEPTPTTETADESSWGVTDYLQNVDRLTAGGLLLSLLLVAAARLVWYPEIVRGGAVVSPGNDPYYYRYWQAKLLDQANGLADSEMLTAVVDDDNRPLTHLLNWVFAELFGSPDAVALWMPVITSVLTGLVLYWLTGAITRDTRVSILAVVLFALAPGHAALTGVGFLDHHIYQYLWLGVLALALTRLAVDLQRRIQGTDDASAAVAAHLGARETWAVAAVLAVAAWASAHIWAGSVLVFVPVALYVWLRTLLDLRAGVPPHRAQAPVLAGVGVGGVLAALFHVSLGWHGLLGGFGPLLVTGGGVGVIGLATLWQRQQLPIKALVGVETGIAVLSPLALRLLSPDAFSSLVDLTTTFVEGEDAVGSATLFSPDQAVVFGPLFQTGVIFYLAVVPLGIATWIASRRYEPRWLPVVCFSWIFLLLATIRLRFVGQLLLFLSVFGAVGALYLLSALDIARPVDVFAESMPEGPELAIPTDRTKLTYGVGVLVVLLVFNLLFVPLLLETTTYSDEEFDAAVAIDEHAEATDREYPANYVLTPWSENRMYNYFVNAESEGYAYARRTYQEFIRDDSPDEWFADFYQENATSGGWEQVGYVVTEDREMGPETTQTKLHEQFGAGNGSLAHYQLVYSTEEIRAFAVVQGATIQVPAENGTELSARTTVQTAGETFTYERTAVANGDAATIRVAYPGEYQVGDRTVQVSEDAVYDGETVQVSG